MLRILLQDLVRLRIHLHDTTVVTPYPVVALLVLGDSVDIAYGHALEVRHRLQTHGHTVLIAGQPHAAQLIQIQVLNGDIGQRCLITLHVGKLAPLAVLLVEHQYAHMVGSHPHQSLRVVANLPHENVVGHVLITLCTHQLG